MPVVIDDGNNRLAAVMQYIQQQQARRREDEAMRQQEEALRRSALARQYGELAPEQRGSAYSALPEDVRPWIIDPSSTPMTAQDLLAKTTAEKTLGVVNGFQPDQFQSGYIATEQMLGRNPNAQFTETLRDSSYMSPGDFATHAREGFVPASEVARNSATATKDLAEASFTAGPKTKNELAHAGLRYAETGKAKAETGEVAARTEKTRKETTFVGTPQASGKDGVASVAERRSAAFLKRAEQALSTIGTPRENGTSIEDEVASRFLNMQYADRYAPNPLKSGNMQKYIAGQKAFTEARLRDESGAAIPPHEYKNDAKMYFFQPGDTKETLEQKRFAREEVLNGLRIKAGRATPAKSDDPLGILN
jgi:hypothetical protein